MKKNIIANPNCSTAQLVIILKPLHDLFKIKRVIISTYQSTSGAGKKAMDELFNQTLDVYKNKHLKNKVFTVHKTKNGHYRSLPIANDLYSKLSVLNNEGEGRLFTLSSNDPRPLKI